jgi:hypothetical protein
LAIFVPCTVGNFYKICEGLISCQPKNGRVHTTVNLPISLNDQSCTEPEGCGSGQTVKLIEFTTVDSQPTFTLATGSCASPGPTLSTIDCGPTAGQPFPGKGGSCLALFP